MNRFLSAIVSWLRAGYPNGVPPPDYLPVLALLSRRLTPDEVKGRNMWLIWTGGNDRLWDELTNLTFGSFDLLKILSSYPGLKYSRDNR